MKWQEIRQHYPASWLFVEALKARSVEGKRILELVRRAQSYQRIVWARWNYEVQPLRPRR